MLNDTGARVGSCFACSACSFNSLSSSDIFNSLHSFLRSPACPLSVEFGTKDPLPGSQTTGRGCHARGDIVLSALMTILHFRNSSRTLMERVFPTLGTQLNALRTSRCTELFTSSGHLRSEQTGPALPADLPRFQQLLRPDLADLSCPPGFRPSARRCLSSPCRA